MTMNIAEGVVIDAAINNVTAPKKWQAAYIHLALIYLSATIPNNVDVINAAIPSVL